MLYDCTLMEKKKEKEKEKYNVFSISRDLPRPRDQRVK